MGSLHVHPLLTYCFVADCVTAVSFPCQAKNVTPTCFLPLPLRTVPTRWVRAEVQDALLSPSPGENLTEGREPLASAEVEALPSSTGAPIGLISVHDVIGTVAMKAKPNAESRCVCRYWHLPAFPRVLLMSP